MEYVYWLRKDTSFKRHSGSWEFDMKNSISVAVIFGSDQGLVGRFNDSISIYTQHIIKEIPAETEIWVVGERRRKLQTGK